MARRKKTAKGADLVKDSSQALKDPPKETIKKEEEHKQTLAPAPEPRSRKRKAAHQPEPEDPPSLKSSLRKRRTRSRKKVSFSNMLEVVSASSNDESNESGVENDDQGLDFVVPPTLSFADRRAAYAVAENLRVYGNIQDDAQTASTEGDGIEGSVDPSREIRVPSPSSVLVPLPRYGHHQPEETATGAAASIVVADPIQSVTLMSAPSVDVTRLSVATMPRGSEYDTSSNTFPTPSTRDPVSTSFSQYAYHSGPCTPVHHHRNPPQYLQPLGQLVGDPARYALQHAYQYPFPSTYSTINSQLYQQLYGHTYQGSYQQTSPPTILPHYVAPSQLTLRQSPPFSVLPQFILPSQPNSDQSLPQPSDQESDQQPQRDPRRSCGKRPAKQQAAQSARRGRGRGRGRAKRAPDLPPAPQQTQSGRPIFSMAVPTPSILLRGDAEILISEEHVSESRGPATGSRSLKADSDGELKGSKAPLSPTKDAESSAAGNEEQTD